MEFVAPGPGALDGIHKCFSDLGGFSESDIIRYVAEEQEGEFRKRRINFMNLWGRPLQLIDCQNLFCEISKYARILYSRIHWRNWKNSHKTSVPPRFAACRLFFSQNGD